MNKMNQKQEASYNLGKLAFTSMQDAINGDAKFTKVMRNIVATKANSYERKGFEDATLVVAAKHATKPETANKEGVFKMAVNSPEVMRIRAKLAKVEQDSSKLNWTVKFGWDGKSGQLNACHLQRVTSAKAPAKNAAALTSKRDGSIRGVKDLDSLLAYAVDAYGLGAVVDKVEALLAQASKQQRKAIKKAKS